VEVELGVVVLPAEEQGAAVVEPEPERAEQAAVQLEEVQEPEQAAVAGLVPALVRPQGQASARVQQLRSALGLMRPSVPVLVLQLVRVHLAGPELVPVPVHPSVQVLAVRSGKEPVMAQLTAPGTKGSDLKTEPALERLSKDTDSAQVSAATGAGSTCPSLSWLHINDILEHPLEESYQAKIIENFKWEEWIDPAKMITKPHERTDTRLKNYPFRSKPVQSPADGHKP
jgi:hypothetical protein